MTAVPAALASRTRAPRGIVRWTRAAVIALLAALAVLIHHEATPALQASSPSSVVAHVMPGEMSGHAHEAAAAEPAAAALATSPGDRTEHAPCAGMAMQHCAPVNLSKVTLVPPADSPAPGSLDAHGAVVLGAAPAGTVGRAPPDLSVLSQLRI